MADTQELREKRAKLVSEAREELDKINDETSEAEAAELEERFDTIMSEADKLKERIDREDRAEAAAKELEEKVERKAAKESISIPEAEDTVEKEQRAFEAWLRNGLSGLDEEQRSIMQNRQANLTKEQRALTTGTDASGGFLIPEGFSNQLEKSLKAFGGMREASRVFSTESGNLLPWPTVDDTANVGELLAENTAAAEQDTAYGVINFNAYTYSSKMIKVPVQLLQDSAFDIGAHLNDMLSERIGRITNTHFTTGTGSAQPNGVVTASSEGVQGATGQTTSIIYEDLVDLIHSVDPAYRNGAIFMMNDSSVKVIRKLKDADGRPLWQPSLQAGTPDSILGFNVVVNQDVAAMAASAKSVLFGDFSKYLIRDVRGITLLRLSERFAESLQVAFLAFSRHDGNLLDAGTDPVRHYANSAT